MNKIAICDDNLTLAGRLEDILLDLQQPYNDIFDIEVFSSGEELIKNLDGGNFYDIAFLDIEMGDTSGIDVGHHIRRIQKNQSTAIIYVSAYDSYHTKLYPVKTTAFIKKPPTKEDVREALDLAFEHMNSLKPDLFIYQFDGRIEKVPKMDIYYFENVKRCMTIVTKHFSDSFYMKMDDLLTIINDPAFVKIHRCYVANVKNILTYTQSEIFFPNKKSLPVSSRCMEDFKRALVIHLK